MKVKMMNGLLLFVLGLMLALGLGLMPEMTKTAYAATSTYTNLIPTGSDLSGKKVKFNDCDWYIIEDNSTSACAGTVTLLYAQNDLGVANFNSSMSSSSYSASTVRQTLDALTASGKFADVADVIKNVNLSDVGVSNAKLYLLSESEARTLPESLYGDLDFQGRWVYGYTTVDWWWLRTPSPDDHVVVVCGDDDGFEITYGIDLDGCDARHDTCGIRPALQLDLSKVYYDSSAKEFIPHTHDWEYYSASDNAIAAACDYCPVVPQTATLAEVPDKTYDGSAAVVPTVEKTSGWTVDNGLAEPSAVSVTPANSANVGTYTASFSVGGKSAHTSWTISAKTVSSPQITLSQASFVYDGTEKKPTVTVTDGATTILASEYSVAYSDNIDAGTATVTITDNDGGNYIVSGSTTFTIARKPLTLTGVTASDKIYDGNDTVTLNTAGAALTGVLDADKDKVAIGEISGKFAADTGAGENKAVQITSTITGDRAENYEVIPTETTATINKKPIKVTADAKTKTFGEKDPVLTWQTAAAEEGASGTGLVEGDTQEYSFTGGLARAEGENAGTHAIVQGDLASANYAITYTGANLTIDKRTLTFDDITLTSASLEYNGATQGPEYTVKVHSDLEDKDLTLEKDADYEVSGTTTAVVPGDSYDIHFQGKGNYDGEVTKNWAITRKSVTVTADAKTKQYGHADPELTATVDGTLGGDTLTYTLSRTAGEALGEYDIRLTGELVQGNYDVTFQSGKLTIVKADGAAAPSGLVATKASSDTAEDGTIAGLTVGTKYEISTDGETTWTEKAADENGVLTGLKAGTYLVRVAGDADTNPGAATELTIGVKSPAELVIDKISALPLAEDITADSETAINEAQLAYDALTAEQKAIVDSDGNGNTKAKLDADVLALAKVKAKAELNKQYAGIDKTKYDDEGVNELSTAKNTGDSNIGAATTLDAIERALDDASKALDAVNTRAVKKVKEEIVNLPQIPADPTELSDTDKEKIKKAVEDYSNLTDHEKSQITDEEKQKLLEAEKALAAAQKAAADKAAADVVREQINRLPASDKVTEADKNDVKAARKAYAALTNDQKRLIDADTLKHLTDDEDKLVILQVMNEVSAKTGMTYTGKPIQLINTPTTALPAGYIMKYAVTTKKTAPEDDSLYTTSIPAKTDVGTYYVWYRVVDNENHADSKVAYVTSTIKKSAPSKPAKAAKPSSTAHTAAGTIDASWKAVAGAKTYELSWRVAGGKWKTKTLKDTKRTIKGLKAGRLYDVRVRAANVAGKGAWSSMAHCWLKSTSKVKMSTGKSKGSIKVSWAKTKGANAGYKVFVYAKRGDKAVATKTLSKAKTSVTVKGLKSGKRYYVRVRPMLAKGKTTYVGALCSYRSTKAK